MNYELHEDIKQITFKYYLVILWFSHFENLL
jgi:hypothetical protein